jgi:hypothetical protein
MSARFSYRTRRLLKKVENRVLGDLPSFWSVSLGCPSATSKQRIVFSTRDRFRITDFTEVVSKSVAYRLSGCAWQFLFLVM